METPDHGVSARFGGCSSHRPPGNKVALGETVRRALSASSTPRIVFGGGDARRKLARRASRWTREVWGLLLASLAAWPLRQPGVRCLSSPLAPPQDRENRHVGGNVFVSFDGFAPVTLCNFCLHRAIKFPFSLSERMIEGIGMYRGLQPSNMCEVSFPGARQRTRGCNPRGLGGEFVLVHGL